MKHGFAHPVIGESTILTCPKTGMKLPSSPRARARGVEEFTTTLVAKVFPSGTVAPSGGCFASVQLLYRAASLGC